MKYTYLISILLLFYIVSKNNVFAQTYTNRVKGDLADPFIYSENGTYYMYGTDYPWAGFWVYTSKDLVKWSIGHECLHSCPTTYGCAFGTNNFWAPELIKKDGFYYLFYAADYGLCVARSSTPEGPFVTWGTGSLWTNQQNNGQWAIDPDYFKDDDGKEYLYYARIGQYGIWVADISTDLKTLSNHQLCFNDVTQDESWVSNTGSRTNEGPEIIKQNGKYYLFYSGNGWQDNYAVGYAVADNPRGPWKKYSGNPILSGKPGVVCPGHNTFAFSPDGKERFIVYHSIYTEGTTTKRGINIDRIVFNNGVWSIPTGPTTTPQPYPSGATTEINQEIDKNNSLLIYPNPSDGNGFNIEIPYNQPNINCVIQIENLQGQIVYNQQLNGNMVDHISIKNFKLKGIYIVKYINVQKVITRKIIIN